MTTVLSRFSLSHWNRVNWRNERDLLKVEVCGPDRVQLGLGLLNNFSNDQKREACSTKSISINIHTKRNYFDTNTSSTQVRFGYELKEHLFRLFLDNHAGSAVAKFLKALCRCS